MTAWMSCSTGPVSADGGVFHFQKDMIWDTYYLYPIIDHIAIDNTSRKWFGTNAGLYYIDGREFKPQNYLRRGPSF